MAEIGSKLRETRIRNKIDIGTVEVATKIRAKYLRALENEEWAVLPGPTYVKTFLRTYAEFLGLDANLLVEEYNARYEQPEELELPAFTREGRVRERVRRAGPPSRWTVAPLVLLAFVVFLLVLGLTGSEETDAPSSGDGGRPPQEQSRSAPTEAPASSREGPKKKARRTIVRLQVVAVRPVWVCVVDARGRPRLDGEVLGAGRREGPFRSSSFRVTIGNGGGDLVINGRRRDTPDRSEPLGYLIRPSRTTVLGAEQRPECK